MIIFGRILGALLILLGLAFNRWILEAKVILDGHINSLKTDVAIVLVQLVLIATGVWSVAQAPRFRAPSPRKLFLLLVSTIFALGISELALHLTKREDTTSKPAYVGQYENRRSGNFEVDNQTGWRMQRNHEFQWTIDHHVNTYRSNAQGFRSDRDFETSPKRLIALAGDSLTWGTGIDYHESFGALLEKQLPGSSIYNFAMPGFGIDQMWMSIRHQALPLRPALVVLAFIDENFDRSLTAYRRAEGFNKPRFVLESGRLRQQTAADRPSRFVQMLQSNSRIWGMVASTVGRLRPFGEWWVLNTAILDAVADDCRQQGVPVLIVRLPQKKTSPFRFKPLADHLRSRGIEFLDLAVPEAPPGIHFKNDAHINAKGHQYVMESIADWIAKKTAAVGRRELSARHKRPLGRLSRCSIPRLRSKSEGAPFSLAQTLTVLIERNNTPAYNFGAHSFA